MSTALEAPSVALGTEPAPAAAPALAAATRPDAEPVALAASTIRAYADALLYAPARTPVVLTGATGTGKTFLARHIHRASHRRHLPFVTRTVAEFDPTLASSQIFGHERGAFTGAYGRSAGAFGEAEGGSFFLDDAQLSLLEVQSMLLRALDSGMYRTVGGQRDLPLRCRILVGIGDHSGGPGAAGRLLPDFLYRLGQCWIHLAPLAERPEEIGPLADCFLRQSPARTGVAGPDRFAHDVVPMLTDAPWPGNLRELEGAVQRAYLHAAGEREVRCAHFSEAVRQAGLRHAFQRHGDRAANRQAVELALRLADGSQSDAARLLRVSRDTVRSYTAATPEGPADN